MLTVLTRPQGILLLFLLTPGSTFSSPWLRR